MLIMSKKDQCMRAPRWALLLEKFDYTVEHRQGKSMSHVDALSRNPLPVMLLNECEASVIARLRKAQHSDDKLTNIFHAVDNLQISGHVVKNDFYLESVTMMCYW